MGVKQNGKKSSNFNNRREKPCYQASKSGEQLAHFFPLAHKKLLEVEQVLSLITISKQISQNAKGEQEESIRSRIKIHGKVWRNNQTERHKTRNKSKRI